MRGKKRITNVPRSTTEGTRKGAVERNHHRERNELISDGREGWGLHNSSLGGSADNQVKGVKQKLEKT